MEKILSGAGVAKGIEIGKAFIYNPVKVANNTGEKISVADIEKELNRLKKAKDQSFQALEKLIARAEITVGKDKAAILQVQQEFLNDPYFYPEIESKIKNNLIIAEQAVEEVVEYFVSSFANLDNEYFRERATDIKDLGRRIITNLSGLNENLLAAIEEKVILVANDLTPSDTIQLDKKYILGFVTGIGGKTSHTAILSRSLGIPAILGIGGDINKIKNDDMLIIDGATGIIILNPNEDTIEAYRLKKEEEQTHNELLMQYKDKPAISIDGKRIKIMANIGREKEAKIAFESGAEGIGLFRTEFLFMNATEIPNEDMQYDAYRNALVAMKGKPVIIRTLDIGGDKELPYLNLPKEMNPFLGFRAIRLTLDRKDLFITQIRAILRASTHGNAKIMFPMISSLQELRQAKAIYHEAKEQLKQENLPYAENVKIGIMIEVPSAAIIADHLAKEVDFFSIGTNDLVQYILAVDRVNENVAYIYDYFHPAVIQMIKKTIDAAHNEGKWVGMCGGMAGDPLAAPLLLGLDLDEWSMDISSLNEVKQIISKLNYKDSKKLADKLLQLGTNEEIRDDLNKYVKSL